MINVLVTGSNGQLGMNFQNLTTDFSEEYSFEFKSSKELDISNFNSLSSYFDTNTIDYCINCAAYTNVDEAEDEEFKAILINSEGAKFLAQICEKVGATLIHISTDFVFDGIKSIPYSEDDSPNPQNKYALSKYKGELAIQKHSRKHFIIRTSWLYSEFGNNFMKTMINISNSKKKIHVVSDQIGTPTYARDLAETVLRIIKNNYTNYGMYHYSNEGVASWYDFAQTIFEEYKCDIDLFPINSESYPTKAKRPYFSVLDKSKIKEAFRIEIPHWRTSLKTAVRNYINH
jgi:dTDP-4-dehydrorhamnose reductase